MENRDRLSDWLPEQYLRFRDERTQPAIDLAVRVGRREPGRVMDLGCGPGNSTAVLAAMWPDAEITGVDSSEAMLEKARQTSARIHWVRHDAAQPMPSLGMFDVIFSNAALQWIPGTEHLLPRLADMLTPGGVLAVQSPYVRELPVYAVITDIVARPEWREYFAADPVVYPLHRSARFFYDILCTLPGETVMWQTEYIHIMESHDGIVEWYKGSGLRPFLNKLPTESLRERFQAEYAAAIRAAYPVERDGKVLLPFNRVFFLYTNSIQP